MEDEPEAAVHESNLYYLKQLSEEFKSLLSTHQKFDA